MNVGFEIKTNYKRNEFYKYIVVFNHPLKGYYTTDYCSNVDVEFGNQYIVAIFKNIKLKQNATATNITTSP